MASPGIRPIPPRDLREDALNLPNVLTLLRIAAIPLVLVLMAEGTRDANFWAALLYAAAAVTDAIDGWLARRQGLVSVLGKFLDPLADKLFVVAVLVFMVQLGHVPAWAVIVVVARELAITTLRIIAMTEGVVIAAQRGGKDKTALQMVAVLLLILHDPYVLDFVVVQVQANLNTVGLMMLYLSIVLALTSGGEYLRLLAAAIRAKKERLLEEQALNEQAAGQSVHDRRAPRDSL